MDDVRVVDSQFNPKKWSERNETIQNLSVKANTEITSPPILICQACVIENFRFMQSEKWFLQKVAELRITLKQNLLATFMMCELLIQCFTKESKAWEMNYFTSTQLILNTEINLPTLWSWVKIQNFTKEYDAWEIMHFNYH